MQVRHRCPSSSRFCRHAITSPDDVADREGAELVKVLTAVRQGFLELAARTFEVALLELGTALTAKPVGVGCQDWSIAKALAER
jgi:hypothetical protein